MYRIMFCTSIGLIVLAPLFGAETRPVELSDIEKAKIRKAAQLKDAVELPAITRPTGPAVAPVRPVVAPMPERLVRAIAAHKELTLAVERLVAKRSEIERWDSQCQEKFARAFGTTDEKVRLAVLARIDQQIQESSRLWRPSRIRFASNSTFRSTSSSPCR